MYNCIYRHTCDITHKDVGIYESRILSKEGKYPVHDERNNFFNFWGFDFDIRVICLNVFNGIYVRCPINYQK